MRIRKGPRCVPLAPTDRSSLQTKGFAHEEGNARREDDVRSVLEGNQELANGTSSAGTERLEDNRVRKRLSADGYSRKCPPIAEGVISISSIIQAGVKSARSDSASAPASAQSVVTSVAPLAKSPPACSPSIAGKAIDEPNPLLQSLKKVCSTTENTGLTAKEAVAKILEQGLPGLIEGGERLIVQVAKLFRSSSAFVEREERGRYFIQESFHGLNGWDHNFQAGDSHIKREKAVLNSATEAEKAIEAATQLQKLQSIKLEAVRETVGFTERVGKSGTGRWVLALRGKSGGKTSTSQKTNVSREQTPHTGLRCNRDDGKGWRCVRLAESGFSLCKYHRDQIRRAEIRRRKARSKSKKRSPTMPSSPVRPVQSVQPVQPEKPSNPTTKDVVKAVGVPAGVPEASKTVDANSVESDNELPDHKRRRFVKAKSLKSIL